MRGLSEITATLVVVISGNDVTARLVRAIVAGNLARLTDQVAAYLNRASRHAVEHDVPLSECLYAG